MTTIVRIDQVDYHFKLLRNMEIIKFSENWNNGKLNLNAFTTIRLEQDKYKVREKYEIVYAPNKKGFEPIILGYAEILAINRFKLGNLSEGMALIDTGYSKAECENIIRTMYWNINNWDAQWLSLIFLKYYARVAYAPVKELGV